MQLPFNKTPVALGRCDRLSGWQSAFEVDGRAHPGGILAGSNLFQPPVDCPITTDADVYNLARERAAQARTTRQKRPADLTMLWSSMIKLGLTRMPAPLFMLRGVANGRGASDLLADLPGDMATLPSPNEHRQRSNSYSGKAFASSPPFGFMFPNPTNCSNYHQTVLPLGSRLLSFVSFGRLRQPMGG